MGMAPQEIEVYKVSEAQLYGIEIIHNHGINARTREIFLRGYVDNVEEEPGVDYRMAANFIENLRYLEGLNTDSIFIHMCTRGGDWNYGMAIYDAIVASPCFVTILAYAHARSMSSIIFQSADRRILTPNADFLIHFGTLELSGNETSVLAEAEQSKRGGERMLDIYVSVCHGSKEFDGWTHKRIKARLREQMLKRQEWYMNPEQAVNAGFADGVLGTAPFETLDSVRAVE